MYTVPYLITPALTSQEAEKLRRDMQGARRGSGSSPGPASRKSSDGRPPSTPPPAVPLSPTDRPGGFHTPLEDRVLNLFLTDGKNLTERKVPGIVSAPHGALEFGVVQAKLLATEFVGFRPLKRGAGVPTSLAGPHTVPVHTDFLLIIVSLYTLSSSSA